MGRISPKQEEEFLTKDKIFAQKYLPNINLRDPGFKRFIFRNLNHVSSKSEKIWILGPQRAFTKLA